MDRTSENSTGQDAPGSKIPMTGLPCNFETPSTTATSSRNIRNPTISKKTSRSPRWKPRLSVSLNEKKAEGHQKLGKYKLAKEDIDRLLLASARCKPQRKSSRSKQETTTELAATSKVTFEGAFQGPSTSASAGAKKRHQRTSTESRNSQVLQGRIDVVEDGVKKRRSARLRGVASVIPSDESDAAEEVLQESGNASNGPAEHVGAEDEVLQNGPTILAEARGSEEVDENEELPGPSRRATISNNDTPPQQIEGGQEEILEDMWSATKECFSVEDFELYAIKTDKLLSGPKYPLYLSGPARSRSKLVDRGDTWYLVQKLGFGKTDFKLITPRPKPRTRSYSTASNRSSTSSTRSSASSNWSTDSEPTDAQTDRGEPNQANLSPPNRGEDETMPPRIDTANLSFELPNSVQIWAKRRSETGGSMKIVVVNRALSNRCRLGYSQNGKFFCLLYASEIDNNIQ